MTRMVPARWKARLVSGAQEQRTLRLVLVPAWEILAGVSAVPLMAEDLDVPRFVLELQGMMTGLVLSPRPRSTAALVAFPG